MMSGLTILAAVILCAESPAPVEASRQGIHLEARASNEVGVVRLLGDETSQCDALVNEPCFLSVEAGRHTFLVDGARIELDVPRGDSGFRIERVPYTVSWIASTVLGLGAAMGIVAGVVAGFAALLSALHVPGDIDAAWRVPWVMGGIALGTMLASVPLFLFDWLRPHTLLVPLEPAHPTAIRLQLGALGLVATF